MNSDTGSLLQKITVPGHDEEFMLGRFVVDGTTFTRHIILDDQLTRILAIGRTSGEVIEKFWKLISEMDNIDLKILIGKSKDC